MGLPSRRFGTTPMKHREPGPGPPANAQPPPPPAVHATGFFRVSCRKEDNHEIIFKHLSTDMALTLAFNLPKIVAEELKEELNAVLRRYEGRILLPPPVKDVPPVCAICGYYPCECKTGIKSKAQLAAACPQCQKRPCICHNSGLPPTTSGY